MWRRRAHIPSRGKNVSPLLTGAALLMTSVVAAIAALTERNRYWRVQALASGALSFAAGLFVWAFGGCRWIYRLLEWVLLLNIITGGRLHMRVRKTQKG